MTTARHPAGLHTVKVTTRERDPGTEHARMVVAAVAFTCSGDKTSPCHQYPACGCEVWALDIHGDAAAAGHEDTPHARCWLAAWFDSGCAVYQGDDADEGTDDGVPVIDREGLIATGFEDEYLTWEWAVDSDAAQQLEGQR